MRDAGSRTGSSQTTAAQKVAQSSGRSHRKPPTSQLQASYLGGASHPHATSMRPSSHLHATLKPGKSQGQRTRGRVVGSWQRPPAISLSLAPLPPGVFALIPLLGLKRSATRGGRDRSGWQPGCWCLAGLSRCRWQSWPAPVASKLGHRGSSCIRAHSWTRADWGR